MTTIETTTVQNNIVGAKEFASLLQIDQATVYKRIQSGKLPIGEKIGNRMVWNVDLIDMEAARAAIRESIPVVKIPVTKEPKVEPIKLEPKEVTGPVHVHFPQLLYFVSRRRHVYMFGPMGSGKSHACQQVAETLGLRFEYVSLNPQSPASLLSGFIDAQGRYSATTFYECYKNGGVFCIDELDNASASLLTTLNSALANGHASFPGMPSVKKHADFVLVATGNTTGRGGDWQYPERRKIDEATLDRLAFINWPYDERLESMIANKINPNATEWVNWIRTVRAYVADKANGIKGGVYATPRSIFAGCEDFAHAPKNVTVLSIALSTVFKGLDVDTQARIINACPLPVVADRKSR